MFNCLSLFSVCLIGGYIRELFPRADGWCSRRINITLYDFYSSSYLWLSGSQVLYRWEA
jgi:hypothetical protein